ncbi:unnamed protein product [Withania somnifera]
MACSSGTCESGCYEPPNDVVNSRRSTEQLDNTKCLKCKVNKTIAANVGGGGGDFSGGDGGRFCVDCFRSNLFRKFRLAVTANAIFRRRIMSLLRSLAVLVPEDLLEHFRLLSLQKIAIENGYTKVLLGTCTSRIACHVLEATAKGRGYSLAADIQYVDARWKIPVEENPSRESTIMRTAGKLTPFHFNRMPEDNDYNGQVASRRSQKKYNLKTEDALPPDPNGIGAGCCASSQFQVLPQDPSSLVHFISLLPPSMVSQAEDDDRLSQRQLREQIEDCLLSDDEDGT